MMSELRVNPAATRADQFLADYARLEHWMRKVLKKDSAVPYKRMVDELRTRTLVTETQALQLTTFGYLRNAIVHWERDAHGAPVADPRQETLRDFSNLVERVTKPACAIDAIGFQDVASLSPEDCVSDFLSLVRDQNFSQVPIVHGAKYRGVLTVGDVARWISTKTWPVRTDFRNARIETVPRSQLEDPEFIERDSTLTAPEAIAAFNVQAAGNAISGIVIVDRGPQEVIVRAMILPWDLPALIHATAS